MKKVTRHLWLLILAGTLAAQAAAQGPVRTIAVVYQPPRQNIPDFYLVDKLLERLALQVELKVLRPEEDSTLPAAPNDRFDAERLAEWGREVGSRYVIYLRVDDRRITARKQPSIPWVLSRYVVEGHLLGIFSLIDLNRNKVIDTWELATRLTGPKQWQFARDYPGDPDLQMSAPRKLTFLDELEAKSVEEIFRTIRPHLRGR